MSAQGVARKPVEAPTAEVVDLVAERRRRALEARGRCEPLDSDRLEGPGRWWLSVPFEAEAVDEARWRHPEAPPPPHDPAAGPTRMAD